MVLRKILQFVRYRMFRKHTTSHFSSATTLFTYSQPRLNGFEQVFLTLVDITDIRCFENIGCLSILQGQ
jgi:hypothetical protein